MFCKLLGKSQRKRVKKQGKTFIFIFLDMEGTVVFTINFHCYRNCKYPVNMCLSSCLIRPENFILECDPHRFLMGNLNKTK